MRIAITDATKRFGAVTALAGVSLDIASGELVALLGPSGSGKTSLLRIIAGLDWPDAGAVRFDGEDALALSVGQRKVGFVFQHYALFRHMTVFENVAFGLRAQPRRERLREAQIRARVAELLDLIQLGDLAARYPHQLSGGQRQRIALARALATRPNVLLLDEPFGALDARVRHELRRWLRELHDDIHVTSVFVTHDQEEALEVADRIVVMDRGVIEQVGTPADIYENPATPFVHDFIGRSIALPVEVTGTAVLYGATDLGLDPQAAPAGPARLFVRPHDIAFVPKGDASLAAIVTGAHGIGPARRYELALQPQNDGPVGKHVIEVDAQGAIIAQGDIVGLALRRYRIFPDAG